MIGWKPVDDTQWLGCQCHNKNSLIVVSKHVPYPLDYKGEYYLQIHETAMGSPVSPIVCNIYFKDFEQRALAEATDPPHWWKRYVDDTYTILKKDQAETFTEYMNTIDDDIKIQDTRYQMRNVIRISKQP